MPKALKKDKLVGRLNVLTELDMDPEGVAARQALQDEGWLAPNNELTAKGLTLFRMFMAVVKEAFKKDKERPSMIATRTHNAVKRSCRTDGSLKPERKEIGPGADISVLLRDGHPDRKAIWSLGHDPVGPDHPDYEALSIPPKSYPLTARITYTGEHDGNAVEALTPDGERRWFEFDLVTPVRTPSARKGDIVVVYRVRCE